MEKICEKCGKKFEVCEDDEIYYYNIDSWESDENGTGTGTDASIDCLCKDCYEELECMIMKWLS